MENLISIFIGIGLSAASGFRIFIPFLILGIAVNMGLLNIDSSFVWLSSIQAVILFALATLIEVAGYFNPWVDNMLDTITTPFSIIAGTILSFSVITGIDPFFKLILSFIIGGLIAADFQFLSVKARSISSVFQGGLGNPFISGMELIFSILLSIFSILLPVTSFIIVITLMISLYVILKNAKARLNEKFY